MFDFITSIAQMISNSLPFPLSFMTNVLGSTAAHMSYLAEELSGGSTCCIGNFGGTGKSDLGSAWLLQRWI